ncbi:similar to Saccharomyces cerevisiae YOR058C ASE1 Mitotic spindle midzone localized microtubule-associated protein (MAP) family member [Maudiozyma saulgeensis]|uniref:Similar to Saccharomyces cerevisiae YOR058C ASE1 Mitotic spindle midzone localized microtubule-associated protein (MAP) family member n=1 Tax=Maudiozyma saulgeensis TaxID=1789683 RepID=A0A1X7QWU0_9SACH|nr:similar to Saccharomyces cerevisiae YOR058C ASE1 Mitotic spindle midzone localized microtubule-associated protein (MAP) family member [Kazachstania saulgeensis]
MDTIQKSSPSNLEQSTETDTGVEISHANDTSTESSIETTLSTMGSRTPVVTHTSQTNASPSKEFMTLTPIRLPENYSPSRNPLLSSSRRKPKDINAKINSLNNYSPTHETIYQEKFNGISSQLTTLLENLNIIYHKIGYSSSVITTKEKTIFRDLSSLLEKFYEEAEFEMKELSSSNDLDQEIINKILIILGDNSGIETIPDLYIRNAILKQSNKNVPQSPKKPLTLLNKKLALETAKIFTLGKYIPKLITFLQYSVTLQKLIRSVNNDNLMPEESVKNTIANLPSLKEVESLLKDLMNLKDFQTNTDNISQLLKQYKKILLDGHYCTDISTNRIKSLTSAIEIYETEFKLRLQHNNEMVTEISTLVNELQINPEEDLHSHEWNTLKTSIEIVENGNLQNIKRLDSNTSISNEQLDILQLITHKYVTTKTNRLSEKKMLITKCRTLWSLLKIPETYIQDFMKQNTGLSTQVFVNLNIETDKLEQEKKHQIKQLINQALDDITGLWDTLSIEEQHREDFYQKFNCQFEPLQNIQYDENLLAICTSEIKELNEKMEIYKPILKLIDEFHSLQEDEIFLDNSSKDSSRLLSRNSHKILLKEENTRKRLTRHFPRVMAELSKKLLESEDVFQRPFLYKNQRMLDIVLDEEESFVQKYPRSRRIMGERISKIRKERIVSNSSINSKSTIGSSQSAPMTKSIDSKSFRVARRYYSDEMRTKNNNNNNSNNNTIQRKISPIRYKSNLTESDLVKNSRLLAEESKLPKFYEQDIVTYNKEAVNERRLLAPSKIVKKPLSTPGNTRPSMIRDSSSNVSLNKFSTPTLKNMPQQTGSSHGIRPTQLFPLSNSKINNISNIKISRIPTLNKPVTRRNIANNISQLQEKENSQLGRIPSDPQPQQDITAKLRSPYREPDHSVYQLSQSPDGKFKLSIQERQLDNPFDDTSLYEE